MSNSDAVAVDLVASNGVIDDIEASTDVVGHEDKVFLAAYQVKLASGRTNLSEDMYFLSIFNRYFAVKAAHA
jgi:hypothetical protein